MTNDSWNVESEEAPLRGSRQGKKPRALFGLAFSGGGIRSATFNLGFIQSLVAHRLLGRVDYLSTVSGGGYAGAWLSAVLRRSGRISSDLRAEDLTGPIAHLRRYSNYLTPRYGVFSTDTLAAVANLVRNLLLNQILLIACLLSALLVPLLIEEGIARGAPTSPALPALLAFLLLFAGAAGVVLSLRRIDLRDEKPRQRRWAWAAAVCGLLAGSLIAGLFPGAETEWVSFAGFDLTPTLSYLLAWTLACLLFWRAAPAEDVRRPQDHRGRSEGRLWFVAATLVAGLAFAALLAAYRSSVTAFGGGPLFTLAFGGPVILLLLCVASAIHIGMGKRQFRESMREWLGRAGGLCLALALAWSLLFGAALYGAAILAYLRDWTLTGGVAWASASGAGIWLARGDKTSGEGAAAGPVSRWRELLAQASPYVFIVGLLFLLAAGAHKGIVQFSGFHGDQLPPPPTACATEERPDALTLAADCGEWERFSGHVERVAAERQFLVRQAPWLIPAAFLAVLLLALLFARRVDINLFSMHQFYRNRLTRCYLGASNPNRRPDPFTDFDLADDVSLAELAAQRPVHLLNCALNLSANRNLAWQERGAASFVFSPAHCGDREVCGSAPTATYLNGRSPYLGTAVAASGAAANPNQGYHTAPALAFIMTFFNVRLGRWLPNPGRRAGGPESPGWGLWYLLRELFAHADADADFVNVSDGGHFENLGIYELVRRRCRLIVACDAGCDPEPFAFEDLGNAVRKCRIDFDAEIRIDLAPLRADYPQRRRHAVARIAYADGSSGVLVYLKPLMNGSEPADLQHYHAAHPEFPQQSTADQWFDESQFESYRRLGELSAESLFAEHPWNLDRHLDPDAWIEAVASRLEKSVSTEAT